MQVEVISKGVGDALEERKGNLSIRKRFVVVRGGAVCAFGEGLRLGFLLAETVSSLC